MDLFYLVILKFSRIRKGKSLEDTTFFKNVIQISNEKILLLYCWFWSQGNKSNEIVQKTNLSYSIILRFYVYKIPLKSLF